MFYARSTLDMSHFSICNNNQRQKLTVNSKGPGDLLVAYSYVLCSIMVVYRARWMDQHVCKLWGKKCGSCRPDARWMESKCGHMPSYNCQGVLALRIPLARARALARVRASGIDMIYLKTFTFTIYLDKESAVADVLHPNIIHANRQTNQDVYEIFLIYTYLKLVYLFVFSEFLGILFA